MLYCCATRVILQLPLHTMEGKYINQLIIKIRPASQKKYSKKFTFKKIKLYGKNKTERY